MVEDGRGMAAPVLLSLFLYGRGREGHGGSRPSVIVFHMVEGGSGKRLPSSVIVFYIVVDGRGMGATVLLSLFFI